MIDRKIKRVRIDLLEQDDLFTTSRRDFAGFPEGRGRLGILVVPNHCSPLLQIAEPWLEISLSPSGRLKRPSLWRVTRLGRTRERDVSTMSSLLMEELQPYPFKFKGRSRLLRMSHPLFFTFLTSNFPTLFVLLTFILWSGFFLKFLQEKEKYPKNRPKRLSS